MLLSVFQAVEKQKVLGTNSESHDFQSIVSKNQSKPSNYYVNERSSQKQSISNISFNFVNIQPKLKVSQPDDVYEQEADQVAEEVMESSSRSLEHNVFSSEISNEKIVLGRKCKSCNEENEEKMIKTIGRNSDGRNNMETTDDVDQGINDTLHHAGSPLDSSTMGFMESRFGFDFGSVKIHTGVMAGMSANFVNALAYTSGNDIVFGEGQYEPNTLEGRKLLAHELTHVVQQNGAKIQSKPGFEVHHNKKLRHADQVIGDPSIIERPSQKQMTHLHEKLRYVITRNKDTADIQRRIISLDGNLVGYFSNRGISVTRGLGPLFEYKSSGKASYASLSAEILSDMLSSKRYFSVDGTTQAEAEVNLNKHIKARKGIVDFAWKKMYVFLIPQELNTDYWEKLPDDNWQLKKGVDEMKAKHDLNEHPERYKLGCMWATNFTMEAGSNNSPLIRTNGMSMDDWVPGDKGYIKNTKFSHLKKEAGREGENIIYTGRGLFWGHISNDVTYKSLGQWMNLVSSWNGGADLLDMREYPSP
jgi:Domain of unknown function (DUF4157)/Protein-glutamine gamma-glutamyltransferase